ncbi:hypothetical protein N431DRAFT_487728 [Stipitochalara longipes BDJ]|nr:hypothetical protein N431DRAFT_487728 [Stipitochalara longipes BDJ]
MACTWQGVEELINQAFSHIDILDVHVNAGHYDLVGPSGEIILPAAWEAMVEPGWSVTMHMWPMPELKGPPPGPPPGFHKPTEIKVMQPEVLNFPGGETVDSEHSLHVVLFPFKFSDQILSESVIINCKLTLPVDHPVTNETFVFASMAFVAPSEFGTSLKQMEDSYGAVEASCEILVENTSEHFFAVLVRRVRSETAVEFSVVFEFKSTHGEGIPTISIQERIVVAASVDGVYRDGLTPFSWALTHKWEDPLKLLLEQWEVLQNLQDSHGLSGLSWAARTGHKAAFKKLLEYAEEDIDDEDKSGRTTLSWAAGEGHIDIVDILLSGFTGVDPDHPDQKSRTPLSWAAEGNHVKIVDLLLWQAKGVYADYPDDGKRTPLSWAAAKCCHDAVSAFINYMQASGGGFNLLIDSDDWTNSPMSLATETGDQKVLSMLVKEQLRQSRTSQYMPLTKHKGWSLQAFYLHKAAENGWANVVESLLNDKDASIDSLDSENECTPLCVAAKKGQLDVVVTLLGAKANHNYMTRTTRDTPLGLAIRSGKKDVVRVLIDAGVDNVLRSTNAKGESPKALAKRYPEIFNMVAAVDVDGKLGDAKELQPLVDHEFKANIVEIFIDGGIQDLDVTEVRVDELLAKPRYPFKQSTITSTTTPSLRWLHLPANNMRWVEASIFAFSLPVAMGLTKSERWVKRQHHGAVKTHHARFMRPHCQQFPTAWPFSASGNHTNLVLFMPFLHWDVDDWRSTREFIARSLPSIDNPEWGSEERLLNAYLVEHPPPLHLRRTLDQYYYHTLQNTTKRDIDQVVSRYQHKECLMPRIITMVDQLWLWVLEGVDGQPDTIISCFPEVGNADPRKADTVRHLDPGNQTNVLEQVKHHLLAEPYSIQTAFDLAGLITATCSRIYLDPGSTLSVSNGMDRWGLQFSELYQTEISDIAEAEANLFGAFKLAGGNQVVNIKYEIDLLAVIKDILDELNIMNMLFDDQRKVLRLMDDIVRSVDKPKESLDNQIKRQIGDFFERYAQSEDQSNDSVKDDGSSTKDEAQPNSNRAARPIWGTRDDRDDFSMPLATVKVSSDEIRAMIERAENAKQALTFLVDLKQKQNDVIDSKTSLEQGRIVLIFTITTIIFLPVSFMTSFFTLPIRQFERDSNGQLGLGYVSYIILPISTAISAILIWVAFKYSMIPNALAKVIKTWKSKTIKQRATFKV